MGRVTRLELTTYRFAICCSTNWAALAITFYIVVRNYNKVKCCK